METGEGWPLGGGGMSGEVECVEFGSDVGQGLD